MIRRGFLAGATVALVLVASATASAEPAATSAAAQSLFNDARALMKKGGYAEACPKLEESQRLDPGLGTQFNLADCNEHIGKVASAWAGFLEVAASAKASRQAERENVARRRAQAIESRVPKLVITAADSTREPGLEIARDGVTVGPASWGTAVAIDPGTHDVVASAPGKTSWRTVVNASEGQVARVNVPALIAAVAPVVVAPIEKAKNHATPAPPPSAPDFSASLTSPPSTSPSPTSPMRTLGFITGGVGLAGLAVGGAFGILSLSKRDAATGHCTPDDVCDATGLQARDDAMRSGNIATIATIAGASALTAGVVLVLAAPSSDRRRGSVTAAPRFASGGGGFVIQGNLP